ncbi:zinc-binding dehydrogenase [Rhodococcus sp. X156]|uniref:zinc-binding dehydrogenase n=1 Tax=Rhodococcus sp. X156 TaxID=2499145 RepID=UPI000FD834CD|nr:zinc-binding dehydrogenase [Rhodococcus sp. X156]
MTDLPSTTLEIRSLVSSAGRLELSLEEVPVPAPGEDEVVVQVEAAPINPSDLGLLFAGADMRTAQASGTDSRPLVTAELSSAAMRALAQRVDVPMPVGNEGSGTVVAAGSGPQAQALLGKRVAMIGGGMFTQYRCVSTVECMPLPEGVTAEQGASAFVNPLTALGMVETMRREGHSALVFTAAASNLGQMLNKICLADGIGMVNIVRKQEQEDLLRELGATHVCNSTSDSFMSDLTDAIAATGATIAFDAIGGGNGAGQILTCMEQALNRNVTEYSRYGTDVHKQVYIYGALDPRPTEIRRNFGFAWGMGGWLLFPFLQRVGHDVRRRLQERVAAELTTTFASRYAKEISLAQALQLSEMAGYGSQSTGTKYLITPNS